MKERRKRLMKYLYKKEGRLPDFERGYMTAVGKKQSIMRKFANGQLENLLRTSTKNVAQEVVAILIPFSRGAGILLEMDQVYNLSLKAKQEDTENNSMANAETEDDELSFAKDVKQKVMAKKPSKKIIFNGKQDSDIRVKTNNFFQQETSPSARAGSMPPRSAHPSQRRPLQRPKQLQQQHSMGLHESPYSICDQQAMNRIMSAQLKTGKH